MSSTRMQLEKLRDQFAGQAMAKFLDDSGINSVEEMKRYYLMVAQSAYLVADPMLAERGKSHG